MMLPKSVSLRAIGSLRLALFSFPFHLLLNRLCWFSQLLFWHFRLDSSRRRVNRLRGCGQCWPSRFGNHDLTTGDRFCYRFDAFRLVFAFCSSFLAILALPLHHLARPKSL